MPARMSECCQIVNETAGHLAHDWHGRLPVSHSDKMRRGEWRRMDSIKRVAARPDRSAL